MQMSPVIVTDDGAAGGRVVLRMQGIARVARGFENFHLVGLGHHRAEETPHEMNGALFQLVAPAIFMIEPAVCEAQPPDGENTVDIVANPGIAVVPVHGYRRARRQKPAHGILLVDDNGADLPIEGVEFCAK